MNAWFSDVKIGNFIASEYGLTTYIVFDANGEEDIDLAMGSETVEDYLDRDTIPLDYGSNHRGKLEFNITFTKDECKNRTSVFTPHEIRSILRELTGKQYYQNMYFSDDAIHDDEMVYYRVKTTNASAKRINGDIVALSFIFTADSFWGYAEEQTLVLDMVPGGIYNFYNGSDETNAYLCPKIEITDCEGTFKIINKSDNNRETIIDNISSGEIVTLNSITEQIESSIPKKIIVDDFNLNWIKFVPNRNQFLSDCYCKLKITYTLLRKVLY